MHAPARYIWNPQADTNKDAPGNRSRWADALKVPDVTTVQRTKYAKTRPQTSALPCTSKTSDYERTELKPKAVRRSDISAAIKQIVENSNSDNVSSHEIISCLMKSLLLNCKIAPHLTLIDSIINDVLCQHRKPLRTPFHEGVYYVK